MQWVEAETTAIGASSSRIRCGGKDNGKILDGNFPMLEDGNEKLAALRGKEELLI